MPQEQEARPPYVRFETRSIEDRNATLEAGHYVGKDVVYALITPAGSKDCIEKVADDWIVGLKEAVQQDRFPESWLREYKAALAAYIEGREAPLNGTAVEDLPNISPSHARICIDIGVRTVEQLAESNEETLQRIGMGGRALKQRAQAWLDSADQGKASAELEALRVEIAALKQRDEEREKELAELRKEREKAKEKA